MVKLISAVFIAVIGFQTWENITQVRKQNAVKTEQMFKPAKQYLTGIISSLNDGPIDLKFKNFNTKAVVPGREIRGYFEISYNQVDSFKGINRETQSVEDVSLNSRAHFRAEVAMISNDGEYWTTKILNIQNTQQDFNDPMIIKSASIKQ